MLAGASIVLPTGRNNPGAGPDIGVGNFYTFRPAIQAAYLPTPNISISGKLTVGINTKNKDNNLRSGSWVGAEAALAYKSPIGAFGAHALYVQQYQDDTGNDWGSSRYRTFNIGPFFTTKIPVLNVSLTVQLIRTSSSRNAKAGDFSQIRMLKVF